MRDYIAAVDFDGTIVEHRFPEIGPIMPGAKETLQWMHDQGIKIIIWTCRDGKYLDEMTWWLALEDIPYDEINNNLPGLGLETSRKIYADWYIDDRSLLGFTPWCLVKLMLANDLKRLKRRAAE